MKNAMKQEQEKNRIFLEKHIKNNQQTKKGKKS